MWVDCLSCDHPYAELTGRVVKCPQCKTVYYAPARQLAQTVRRGSTIKPGPSR